MKEVLIDSQLCITATMDRIERFLRSQVSSGPVYIGLSRKSFSESEEGKKRSKKQNSSLHLYCEMLSEVLNNAGLDMRIVLSEEAEISWSKASVLEKLWRPLQKAITNKTSTTKPTQAEYKMIYEELSRHLSEKFAVDVEWPSEESLIRKSGERDFATL